jgi:hypothetical protein
LIFAACSLPLVSVPCPLPVALTSFLAARCFLGFALWSLLCVPCSLLVILLLGLGSLLFAHCPAPVFAPCCSLIAHCSMLFVLRPLFVALCFSLHLLRTCSVLALHLLCFLLFALDSDLSLGLRMSLIFQCFCFVVLMTFLILALDPAS